MGEQGRASDRHSNRGGEKTVLKNDASVFIYQWSFLSLAVTVFYTNREETAIWKPRYSLGEQIVCWEVGRVHRGVLWSWWGSLASSRSRARSPPARPGAPSLVSGFPRVSRRRSIPPKGIGNQLDWVKEGEGEASHWILNLISFRKQFLFFPRSVWAEW